MLDVMRTNNAHCGDDAETSSGGRSRLREAGFTLIELLIVVAIAVAVMAVGLPNLMRSKMRAEMMGEVSKTQQAFSIARINAVQGAAPVVVELRQNPMGWELYSWKETGATPEVQDPGEPEVGRWTIPDSKFLIEQDPAAALRLYRLGGTATRRGVVFFPNGAGIVNETGNIGIGQGGLRIADKKGNQFRLLVQAGTGTIIRQMWDPKTSTWDEKSMRHWRY